MAPGQDVRAMLIGAKTSNPRQEAATFLSTLLPRRLAQCMTEQHPLIELTDKQLRQLGSAVNDCRIVPHGTEGYRTAEVTLGGVDTAELSSKTMESRKVRNLYFIGE